MLIPYSGICSKYQIKPTGVLHVGAHWAEEAQDYYDNGCQRSIWIEANPECMMKLMHNLEPYSNHIIFNDCISDIDGREVALNISNNEGQSSSILELQHHKVAHPEVHYIGSFVCKTKRLDTLFYMNKLNIEDYPFVNMDIQGVELLALKGMGQMLAAVKYLYLEINSLPLYEDCALVKEVDEYVRQYGFVAKDTVMAGNFGWGDKFYINENL